jgi:hypothetical protein
MKPRVNLRLDAGLLAQVEQAAERQRTTKTDILEGALRVYFDPDRRRPLEERLFERLANFERRMGRLEWNTDLNVEIVSHYIFYWLVRTDPLPIEEREAAHGFGKRRFEHFIGQIAQKVGRKLTLARESRRWEVSDPDPG